MASVHSAWASTVPSISGTFSPGEWAGAGVMPMPGGFVLVKNDANYLYLALDLVSDTGNTPGVGDYFWLSFDNDRNAAITSNFDVNYGIYPSLPIRIARQYYLAPGAWTGILGGLTTSATRQGFSATPNSATPHRIWEIRVALSEIGVPSLASMGLPFVRFGLRVSSTSPAITTDFPPNFFTNFLNLHEIYLATGPASVYPPGTAGPVIAGVGLIPFTTITGGRATTAPTYVPAVTAAAFGGILNFIYNRPTIQALWAAGARKYVVRHRFGAGASYAPLRRTWVNYRWTGTTYVLDSFGPGADDAYPLVNPVWDYSTKDLLFQWNTGAGEPTGLHQFQVEFQNATGAVVAAPAQTLELFVDNSNPDLRLYEITYKGATVAPCSIVDITETADPVRVHFRAFDVEGDLRGFSLYGYYGGPGTSPISLLPLGMGNYPGAGLWNGLADQWIDCPMRTTPPIVPAFPPVSCAYEIRLAAWPRLTDGYSYIGYTDVTTHVTFRRPGVAPFGVAKPLVAPFGFKANRENLFVIV